jgi:spore germination protein KB
VPRIQISGGLFTCLIGVYLTVAQYLFLPAPLVKEAGQEAWLALVIAGFAGTLVAGVPATLVAVRHARLGPGQIARHLLGKWVGGLVSMLYAGGLLFIFGLCLRDIVDFTQMVLLPGTPGVAIVILFGGLCLYGIWHGLEPLVRVAFQTLVFMVVAAGTLPLLQLREISIKHVDPFLYRGWGALVRATFIALPWYTEIVAVMALVQHLKHPRKVWTWLAFGSAAAVVPLAMLTFHMTLSLGSELPGRFLYPMYYLVQLISVAKIIERIEIILVIIFLTGMFIKSSLYLYIASEATAHTFGLKDHRGAALLLVVIGGVTAHLWGSTLNLIYWEDRTDFILLKLGLEVGIPVLLLTASVIRQLVRGQGSAHA